MAVFRDLRKRVTVLEERLGKPDADTKSGLFLEVSQLADALRKLRKEIESWSDEPPSWANRLRRSSSANLSLEILQDYENRFEQRCKGLIDRVKRVEEALEEHEKKARTPNYITKSEYEEDSRHRAEEITKIQANLSSANGFLRGVMSALGYLDDTLPRRK
jgi:predicted RNase H-like nuclease (RuvC/YqgF family)